MGSKAKLAKEIIKLFPKQFNTYYEPFFGGGSVFFELQPLNAVCADLMAEPTTVINAIKDRPNLLYKKFKILADELWERGEEYYYEIRTAYNTEKNKMSNVDRAASFLFLLRAGFNGVIRFNPKTLDWNVPYGKRGCKTNKTTKLYSVEFQNELKACSVFLQEGIKKFQVANYKLIIDLAGKNDIIYADPPYSMTASDKRYNMSWTEKDDIALHDSLIAATDRGAFFVLSNVAKYKNIENVFLLDLYKGFKTQIIQHQYVVGPKQETRQQVEEILIFP